MKKMLAVLFVVSLCAAAFGKGKRYCGEAITPTVAVYMVDAEPNGAAGVHAVFRGELVKAISRSWELDAVNSTDPTLKLIAQEHFYQRGGAVSKEQRKAVGKQSGVQFVCAVKVSELMGMGEYFIDVRLVDVESAVAKFVKTDKSNLRNVREMEAVAWNIAGELAKFKPDVRPIYPDPNNCISRPVGPITGGISISKPIVRMYGGRSRVSIVCCINARLGELRVAYSKRCREKGDFNGKVTVKFSIDEYGKVVTDSEKSPVEVVENTTNDTVFGNTVLNVVKSWRFDDIRESRPGDITEVTYPFAFSQD